MINGDVDEYLVPTGRRDVFTALDATGNGVLGYGGHWIEPMVRDWSGESGRMPRAWDFWYKEGVGKPCGPKWSGRPGDWPESYHPTPHHVRGADCFASSGFYVAHFRGVNSGWRFPGRREISKLSPGAVLDRGVVSTFRKVFGDVIPDSIVLEALEDSVSVGGGSPEDVERDWLAEAIAARTVRVFQWTSRWVWRTSVLVFEYDSDFGRVAFDCAITREKCSLAVSVRDRSSRSRLEAALACTALSVVTPVESGKGFVIDEWSARKVARSEVAERVARQMIEFESAAHGLWRLE